jgi:hypothetical protein
MKFAGHDFIRVSRKVLMNDIFKSVFVKKERAMINNGASTAK